MLAKDENYRKRLELIQDFDMPTACNSIKMTKDKEHIIVSGTYPPCVKCYTVRDLSMKFQRGLTCEAIAFETLSDDFGKMVFLQSDRTLSFHAPYGTHYNLRIPKFGRQMQYNWGTCDLFVAAAGDEVYRLNLESGQFKSPITLEFSGCNKMSLNPIHELLACGGESPVCEFWDTRSKKLAARLIVESQKNVEINEVRFDSDGLTLGVGTSSGNCILYDIRSSKPLFTKEHQYGYPVFDIYFHNDSKSVISTDKKILKIWERNPDSIGKIITNIETPSDINMPHFVSDQRGQSGLILIAGEQSKIMSYFVPQLGPAPRWCSFLENLTEELEESAERSNYEDYKFLTRTEVEDIGATSLIGTPMLKSYMHGFFIEMKMYSKLRAVSKPFEYEEYMKKKIKEKIDTKREKRIVPQKKVPKVNKELAKKMYAKSRGGSVVDERFSGLFEREEFQQDHESLEYKLRNPSKGMNSKENSAAYDSEDDLQGLYRKVEEDHEWGVDYDSESGSDTHDDADHLSIASDASDSMTSTKKSGQNHEENEILSASSAKIMKSKGPEMYELQDRMASTKAIFRYTADEKKTQKESRQKGLVPLNERLKDQEQECEREQTTNTIRSKTGIVRESSYIPAEDKIEFSSKSKTKPRSFGNEDTTGGNSKKRKK